MKYSTHSIKGKRGKICHQKLYYLRFKMLIITKIKKNFFSKLFNNNLEKSIRESKDYTERQQTLNHLIKNEMRKPSIKKQEIITHIDDWEEYTIQHIYSDMQVLKKSFTQIRLLPNIKDIKYNSNTTTYNLIMEKGSASIIVRNYEIKLTAWNLSEEKSIEILNLCIDEIIKVQNNMYAGSLF